MSLSPCCGAENRCDAILVVRSRSSSAIGASRTPQRYFSKFRRVSAGFLACSPSGNGPLVPIDIPESPELVALLGEVCNAAEPELQMERRRGRIRKRDARDDPVRIRSVDRLEEYPIQLAAETTSLETGRDVDGGLHRGVVRRARPVAAARRVSV